MDNHISLSVWPILIVCTSFDVTISSPFSHSNHINAPFRSIVFFCCNPTEIYRVEQMGFKFDDYSGFSQNHPPQTFLGIVYNQRVVNKKIKKSFMKLIALIFRLIRCPYALNKRRIWWNKYICAEKPINSHMNVFIFLYCTLLKMLLCIINH